MPNDQTAHVHLVCQAHIDPIWIWDWEEGLAEALATFEAAADLLDEYPEFVFNHNESLLYAWVRDYRPELFRRIRDHVSGGRWVITGGWFLQPDCNLPLGESFARQILLGRTFFRSEFGVEPKVAYNLDSFGHHANMPQFLRLAGYESYVHFRPLAQQKPLPDFIYTWQGVDGTRIPTLRPPCVWYCTHPADALDGKIARIRQLVEERGISVTCFWGAGNHGGGATRQDLETIRALSDGAPPLEHGSLEDYCRDVVVPRAGDHEPVEGELQKCFVGCYTSTIGIKQRNRRGEGLALAAERYAALAWWLLGEEYPADTLRSVWQDVLFNQFHDILPGSAIRAGVSSSAEIMGRAFTNAREVMIKAQLALSRSREDKRPLTLRLFNPHPVRRRIAAIVDVQLATHPAFLNGKRLALYDAQDQLVPRQLLAYRCSTAAWRNTFLFEADLCAGGISEYRIEIEDMDETAPAPVRDETSPEGFVPVLDSALSDATCTVSDHTPWYSADASSVTVRASRIEATVCRATGRLTSLVDTVSGAEMLSGPSGSLIVREDTNNAWGGDLNAYGDVAGAFELPEPDDLASICGHHGGGVPAPAVRVVASGPLAVVVEVVQCFARSVARTRYMFHRNQPFVDVELLVNWTERCRMVQYEFATSVGGDQYAVEIPHASVTRSRGQGEEPCGRWTMLFNDDSAFALVNNGTGGVEVSGNTLRQSLLRSATFCAGEGKPKPGFMQEHMSLGEHMFSFRLAFGTPDTVRHALPLLSDDLTLPFSCLSNIPLDGSTKPGLECGTEPIRLDADGLVHLEAVKRSEDGKALIVRLAERNGCSARGALTLSGAKPVSVRFSPYQIKTLRFERDGDGDVLAEECNLLERAP